MADAQKQITLSANVSPARKPTHTKLVQLAEKWKARLTDVVWDAIERYLANPPEKAPESARPAIGKSHGFWVVHNLNKNSRVIGVRVVECVRHAITGRTFHRYKDEDEKSKLRALRQAQNSAAYDATICGLKVPEGGFQVEKIGSE